MLSLAGLKLSTLLIPTFTTILSLTSETGIFLKWIQSFIPSQKLQAAPGRSWMLLVWESCHGSSWKILAYFTFLALF